jgi:hypothetical protein
VKEILQLVGSRSPLLVNKCSSARVWANKKASYLKKVCQTGNVKHPQHHVQPHKEGSRNLLGCFGKQRYFSLYTVKKGLATFPSPTGINSLLAGKI